MTMSASELERLLEVALGAARDAAKLLQGARPAEIRAKGTPKDLVTEWDHKSEALIRERLTSGTPDIPIVGEEGGGAGGARRWLVDPIDGTVNFAHGLPLWAISIGLEDDERPMVGVVCAPALHWTFWAWRGGGAFVDEGHGANAMHVSAASSIDRALLVTGFPYDRATSPHNNFAQWEHFQRKAGACRRLGAAALDLALVARGAFDGYWERKLQPWDTCAGALLVEEAGGRVTDTRGGRFLPQAGEAVATNGAIHDELLAELAMADASQERTS
ncbi:MAG TPA: inositol monophosphatase family protein [Kofleriaceae bacterium]|jgi:myo-inositol-1(or 4)-monophosphatase|nr:inositol monophosphatase family protein [Kofleriaceae bacterium]